MRTFTVNREGIAHLLKNMFSSELSFLTEACQNAERAKATSFHIDYLPHENTLLLTDDGCGFGKVGWDAFFSATKSGWSKEVQETQLPFGVGACALLFAASEVAIWSNQDFIEFKTNDFLDGTGIEVVGADEAIAGTMIALRLKEELKIDRVLNNMHEKLEGFTIPVFIDGEKVKRPFALDSGATYIETDIGFVSIPANFQALKSGFDYCCYLQGFLVYSSLRNKYMQVRKKPTDTVLLHLDSTAFRAKAPDRNALQDHPADFKARIKGIVEPLITEHLAAKQAEVGLETFATDYWSLALKYAPHLIKNSPAPKNLFLQRCGQAYRLAEGEAAPLEYYDFDFKEKVVSLDIIQDIKCYFEPEQPYSSAGEYPESDHSIMLSNYLYASNAILIERENIPKDHLLNERVVELEYGCDIQWTIKPKGKTVKRGISTFGVYEVAVVCDSFTLSGQAGETILPEIEIFDEALWFNGSLYVASKADIDNSVARQISDCCFTSGDWLEIDETALERITDELSAAIELLRNDDSAEAFKSIVGDKLSSMRILLNKGKKLHLSVTVEESKGWPLAQLTVTEMPEPPKRKSRKGSLKFTKRPHRRAA